MIFARVFDHRFRFNIVADLRRTCHRQHEELGAVFLCQSERRIECLLPRRRAIDTYQDLSVHGQPRADLDATAVFGAVAGTACSSSRGSRWRGRNQAFAISVGTTALPITAATRAEYCAWSMM